MNRAILSQADTSNLLCLSEGAETRRELPSGFTSSESTGKGRVQFSSLLNSERKMAAKAAGE